MLTNLSTEQLIGQPGQSFSTNMGPVSYTHLGVARGLILPISSMTATFSTNSTARTYR